MPDTPPATMATVAVHEALIRQLVEGQRDLLEELRLIGRALSQGDVRFSSLEQAQAACRAQHDSDDNRAARALPPQVAVLTEQMATMRLVVYGAVGVALTGLLGTLGVVMVKVLGQP